MHICLLSRQIDTLPSSSGWFIGSTIDNPKNELCKDVETGFGVITEKDEDEIVKEDMIETEEYVIEKEESNNLGDQEERAIIIDQLIDKNSPWRRTKKQVLSDSKS